ncbi:Homeodomain-like protein, partial [Lentinula edodes]
LSDDLRKTIVYLRKTCSTLNEISQKSNCKKRTIQCILAEHRKTRPGQELTAELRGRKRIEDLRFVHGLLTHTPDMYLDEIRDALNEWRGVLASTPTLWHVLKLSGYTLKKVR